MTISMLTRYLIFGVVFLLHLSILPGSLGASGEMETLETLLKELRELRESKYQLMNQWKDEKQELELIKTFETEKLEVLKKEEEHSSKQLGELKKKLSIEQQKNKDIDGKLTELKTWLEESCQNFLEKGLNNSVLLTPEIKDHLEKIVSEDKKTSEKINSFFEYTSKFGRRWCQADG